jgi:hypothetical protein|tara:strand:+ start:254 stop:379 length:126 start_codon:yes stop_codon:yes gene_type:complete
LWVFVGFFNDGEEVWLEGGTTDEESIDVFLRDKFSSILGTN